MNTPHAQIPVAAVFMVEPGAYEWPAILLAASLRAFANDDVRVYAYCRAELIDQLHPATLAFCAANGVTLDEIHPAFEVVYPQGNKLFACAAPRPEPATVLFDTDMFMLQPALLSDTLQPGTVAGRPTGNWMWGRTPQDWAPAYESVGLPLPRLRMSRPDQTFTMPSMSAGYVAYMDSTFADLWCDTAIKIERRRLAKGIYPTLDQISLPIAAQRAGLRLNLIDVRWNKAGKITDQAIRQVIFYHYQKADTLLALPVKWLADRLLQEFSQWSSVEDLLAFYDREAARPATVIHNTGWRNVVEAGQLAVDIPHRQANGSRKPTP
ncbi:hypothetical protein SAMN04488003_13416 [Loktanella fryxellensis]|uniref:Glycosyl transferase family 8 n=1 Tax=Loktanella fryxellensis TaxID=245187 RepID=A0A1H8J8L9_9RHOB|nr:hypothetical protein [Loktanella fryxellensis]SEN77102.1 hypothetical protein SAMN04488003_13416 [Loktanella fryxellensis]